MKRVLCYVLILALIVPVFLVPVLAATVYEFGPIPFTLSQFDFIQEAFETQLVSCYDGYIPEGRYTLSFYEDDILLTSEPFDLVYSTYSDLQFSDFNAFYVLGEESFSMPMRLISYSTPESVVSLIGIFYDNVMSYDMPPVVFLTSVDSGGFPLETFLFSVTDGFVDYNMDTLTSVFVSGLSLACFGVICWFGYRFVKRKVIRGVFKGKI